MRLVVLGAGESGTGAALLGKQKGYEVFVSDKGQIAETYKNVLSQAGISFEEQQHTASAILDADVVVKSPGIPDSVPLIKELDEKGIEVIDELEFAFRFKGEAKVVAITGSNGKTTTATLTHHIIKQAGVNTALVGNVGKSFATTVANNPADVYVVEVSSFQLDRIKTFKPNVAILLNITPDHLDRYNYKLEEYAASKMRITMNQDEQDALVYCKDDELVAQQIEQRKCTAKLLPFSLQPIQGEGACIENKEIIIKTNDKLMTMPMDELALKGQHNAYNSMASGVAARVLELRKQVVRESMSNFENVEHRLEFVTKVHGISFINDSKATNVNAAWYALESVHQPVVWIVGGVDKGNDYTSLKELVKDKVSAIVCLGKENEKIKEEFAGDVSTIVETQSAIEAVQYAYQLAEKNGTVLLSPACASFDLFKNYEDRGHQFKNAVRAL